LNIKGTSGRSLPVQNFFEYPPHPPALRTLKNEERSTNVIVPNLSGDKILFSTFYTDLFLLFGPPPPAPPLATLLNGVSFDEDWETQT